MNQTIVNKPGQSLRNKIYPSLFILILATLGIHTIAMAASLNLDEHNQESEVRIEQHESILSVTWPTGDSSQAQIHFNMTEGQPLIEKIAFQENPNSPADTIAINMNPLLSVRVGDRDLKKRGGWTIFFDRMQNKKSKTYLANIKKGQASASSTKTRAVLRIGEVTAGPFQGEMRWTFYAGSPFVLQEFVMASETNGVAYLYDTGLAFNSNKPNTMNWHAPLGEFQSQAADAIGKAEPLAVKGRTLASEFPQGTIALFPPPHRYFYPLDFSNNFKNFWMGSNYGDEDLPFGFGIRHDPKGDNRYVPWFNAPPDTHQEMGIFLYIVPDNGLDTLDAVAKLTRKDHYAPLDGHTVFTSHYHVEHTREVVNAQKKDPADSDITNHMASGSEYRIPERLQDPGFMQAFKSLGVDIVHLAEFHFGETPRWGTRHRLRHLEILHAECERLSDDNFLLLPGEEPNVHLGGHWISFFPKPVHWVLNRNNRQRFKTEDPELGAVYHVGNANDILKLLEQENGLAWTAHPRIKGSTGFPDIYQDKHFYTSDRFLGGAWKAMPADLSEPRLGSRVLGLLDDMANWGNPKYTPGEVDVFKIEPDHELYAHMNVNYLRINEIPKYTEGWQPVVDALQQGQFFVTTGEVLIPKFTVNEKQSGETAPLSPDGTTQIVLNLEWTFPLERAFLVSGDGENIEKQEIDLSHTLAFGKESLRFEVDLKGKRWVRIEVWDIATNGAFTQPVWLTYNL